MTYRNLTRADLDAMYVEVASYIRSQRAGIPLEAVAARFNMLMHEAWSVAYALRQRGLVRCDGRMRKWSTLVAP